MPARRLAHPGPVGGLRAGRRTLRRWVWRRVDGGLLSEPVRCRGEQWYLVRARDEAGALIVRFERDGREVGRRALRLGAAPVGQWLAWFETPPGCKAVRLELPAGAAARSTGIESQAIACQDTVSHPLANVPRWDTVRPPLPPRGVVLPQALASLAGMVDWTEVRVSGPPTSRTALARLIRRAAVVVDPGWCVALGLGWRDLEALAADAWLILDLETAARLRRGECRTWRHPADVMSARIEHSDVPTRGFALQDVVPYGFVDARGRFGTRVIRATCEWKAAARKASIVTLASSETPWQARSGDILSAWRLTERGALLMTDLPWLVGGVLGPPLAPRLTAALLRAHLCGPVADHVQYWNRSDETQIVVRDLAELARRCPPLRAVRWRSSAEGLAHLGIALVNDASPSSRTLTVSTGRIDALDAHDGLPPEPMTIFMKWLAREWREQTDWARRHLVGRTIVWQFDTAMGHKYAVEYDSAAALPGRRDTVVRLRSGDRPVPRAAEDAGQTLLINDGLLGDGSLAFQDELTSRLRRLIEQST